MPALLRRRCLERRDLRALRIELPDYVLDRAALSRGVHALQHEQHAALAAGLALGVEHLLQVRQPRREFRLDLRGRGLATVDRRSGARID